MTDRVFPNRPSRDGWQMCVTRAGAVSGPDAALDSGHDWIDAPVPGTVAQALTLAGRFDGRNPEPLGGHDYWYRLGGLPHGRRLIELGGLATIAEVWIGGEFVLRSTSMFVSHTIEREIRAGGDVLYLCFRSLDAWLREQPPAQRARWRPRLIENPALRTVRTTLLGHMPGWYPRIETIGPWRAIDIVDPAMQPRIAWHAVQARVTGRDGLLDVTVRMAEPLGDERDLHVTCGAYATTVKRPDPFTIHAVLAIPDVKLWWPHTHGEPFLYDVSVQVGGTTLPLGRAGFRTIAVDHGRDGRGFALSINGVPLFARGACWATEAPLTLHAAPSVYRGALERAREAGFNMLRVGGTMTYEADAFYALCDELGLLIWQDFMFGSFDYPWSDSGFAESVAREATQFLARHAIRPSLAVFCGGSEIAQQAAMYGLAEQDRADDPAAQTLARLVAAWRPDALYVPHSPDGGVLPFTPRERIAHYYGVGAWLRPLEDARRADVRFAAECLAFANVPCEATLEAALARTTHAPGWTDAVPSDPGASWDFDDVRDHYLRELYDQDPVRLRRDDPLRYFELSRAATADVFSETLAEWRRVGSRCAGALVWQFQDVKPGAGWGVIDALKRPKSAWYAMKHTLQRQQILLTDEGLNGLDIHVLNDGPDSLTAQVEIVALRDGTVRVARGRQTITIGPHGGAVIGACALTGQFFDFTFAYRFGPLAHDAVIASMYDAQGAPLSQAFYFPERAAAAVFERHDIGLEANLEPCAGRWRLAVKTRSVARYVQIHAPGFLPSDNWFHLAPGHTSYVDLLDDPATQNGQESGSIINDVLANAGAIEVRAVNSRKIVYLKLPPESPR
ncbi:MAG: glycoside hydrolase family 2 protein [Paraburkholderia sp.]|jgi:beta-mannosidase|nr:glycoside hydrolase family 2 protein [Paraburkholderia sp.]